MSPSATAPPRSQFEFPGLADEVVPEAAIRLARDEAVARAPRAAQQVDAVLAVVAAQPQMPEERSAPGHKAACIVPGVRADQRAGIDVDDAAQRARRQIVRNVCAGGRWDEVAKQARPLTILEPNFVQGDPLFVNADKQDFRLRAESPVWAMGFKPIPIEKIGLYQDEFRATWPVRHQPLPEYQAATPGAIPEDVPAKRR